MVRVRVVVGVGFRVRARAGVRVVVRVRVMATVMVVVTGQALTTLNWHSGVCAVLLHSTLCSALSLAASLDFINPGQG